MMRKYILITFMLLLIAGCQSKQPVVKNTPFIGGTDALKMSFLPATPPDEIYDNGKGVFGVFVELENVGEADVLPQSGYVEVIGINPVDFGLQSQDDLLEGINVRLQRSRKNFEGTTIKGDRTVLEFPQMRYLPDIHGNTPIKIRAELCHDYRTSTSTNICVKRDVLNTGLDTNKICEVTGSKDVQNSGGPVQITAVKENPIGDDSVQLILEIEHAGGDLGRIYKIGSVCDDSITNFDRNKVLVSVTSDVNGRFPQCSGLEDPINPYTGIVTLFDGQKRAITCTLDLAGVNSIFEELFTVDLDYRYSKYIEKEVVVRDVSTG